jgi:hypothetical protein
LRILAILDELLRRVYFLSYDKKLAMGWLAARRDRFGESRRMCALSRGGWAGNVSGHR